MKNSTFLLAFIMFAFLAGAQNKNDLLNKFQQLHEKNAKIIQKNAHFSNLLKANASNNEFIYSKSAAAQQKLDSSVTRILNTDTQLWQYDNKDEFIYDSNFKNTAWLSKEWKLEAKKWEIWIKTELGYDSHNRVNSMIMSELDTLNNELVPYSKMNVYYNSEGLQDSTISFFTEDAGEHWLYDLKQLNYYNTSKQLTKLDVWALDEESGVLTLSMNVLYTYTSGKIKTSTTNYLMEGDEIPWSKTVYNYDGSGILTSTEDWDLNFMTFTLEKTSRNSFQYNAAGDVSVDIYSSWNGTSWVDEEKDETTYNSTNFSDIIFPKFIGLLGGIGETTEFIYNKAISGTNTFEMINGSWKNTEKTVFYYSGGTSTNIDESGNTLFNVYPNPASNSVSFRWKGNYESLTLEMYQITGVKVMEQIAYPGKLVSISKFENGIYFYKLLNGQQTIHTGKLIKE